MAREQELRVYIASLKHALAWVTARDPRRTLADEIERQTEQLKQMTKEYSNDQRSHTLAA